MIFGLGLHPRDVAHDRPSNSVAAPLRSATCAARCGRACGSGLIVAVPIWLLLWQTEAILLAMGQDPALSAQAAAYMRALQWALLPFYWYIVLRSFTSALERPGWAMVVMFVAVAFNIVANWALIFGNLGFPAMGIVGAGIATTASSTLMFAGMARGGDDRQAVPALFDLRPLLARRLAAAGANSCGSACRSPACWRFEVRSFNAAALLMGLIDATALAAHAIAIQIASITFMVPMGLGQAATVRVGAPLARERPRRHHPRRLDGVRAGRRLHGTRGARHAARAARC